MSNVNIPRARDVMAAPSTAPGATPHVMVEGRLPLVDLLHRLADAEEGVAGVVEDGRMTGIVTPASVLAGLAEMLAPRDDSSLICVECAPGDYSAAALARAVEDADAHLVDLWTAPTDHGTIAATLRVRVGDPSGVCHHLERYGFEVTDSAAVGGAQAADAILAAERLLELKTILSI